MANYYEILGLKPGASKKEITAAYRKLAMKYHPDVNPNNKDAEIKMKELNEAYAYLVKKGGADKTHQKQSGESDFRKGYEKYGWQQSTNPNDRPGTRRQTGFGGDDFKKMYDDLFKNRKDSYRGFTVNDDSYSKNPNSAHSDSNIYCDYTRSIVELMRGTDISAKIERRLVCAECLGGTRVCKECGGNYMKMRGCKTCGGSGLHSCKTCGGTLGSMLNRDINISVNLRKMPVKINTGDNGKRYAILKFTSMGNQGLDSYNNIITGDLYIRIEITGMDDKIKVDYYTGSISHQVDVKMSDIISGKLTLVTVDGISCEFDLGKIQDISNVSMKASGMGVMSSDNAIGDYVFSAKMTMPDFSKLSEADVSTILSILEKIQ